MKRIAVVDNTKLKDMQQKEHIMSLCPVNRTGTECIKIIDGKLYIDEVTCIGCGICTKKAPDAIKIINLPEALNENPIFRYAKNSFALYNIPIPTFGKVVGIIGRNGIGKSTAIKLLAGIIKPNFGDYTKESTEKEVIDFFKGTEAQAFFEKLHNGEIKVSYKPQNIDMIPKQYNGIVIELLTKVDEQGRLYDYVNKLDLNHILNSNINQISGGELQRVAIAATLLKKANLYIFDEPTSYLDIKQKIKVTHFIRDLINDDIAILMVEHDLIILDYIADNMHLLYGKENVYGVVSGAKATKNGINTYLSGFLKEENIRFRENAITFDIRPPVIHKETYMLSGWEKISTTLGNFKLQAKEGTINKSDVIGVIGENGIGKTSFIKILAGVLKPDQGNLLTETKISYKPQYLNANDELVISILENAITHYKALLVDTLKLEPIFYQKLSDLSGGQLQRVAIAKCLSEEADLFLLDEPSAYLDVEQRLIISKMIRTFAETTGKSILIVDHDLLFIDYIADKVIVFSGTPAIEGIVNGPYSMTKGMNHFLKELKISFRRDEETNRPRANKLESQMDRQQKSDGKLYYK